MFLGEFLSTSYFVDHPELAKGTRQNLCATIRTFERFLGRPARLLDLDKLTVYRFMEFCNDVPLLPKTINNKRGDLVALWNCAAENNLLSPPPRIKKRKEPTRLPIVWTIDEMRKLFEATNSAVGEFHGIPKSILGKLCLLILWDSGVRIGTLRKARIADVNLQTRSWFVPAENIKGRMSDRVFQLHPDTIAVIAESLKFSREKLVPLPSDRNTLYKWMTKLVTRAGLPADRMRKFHCIRRSAETHAAASKGIAWAASAIGHSEAIAKKYYVNPQYIQAPILYDALPRIG